MSPGTLSLLLGVLFAAAFVLGGWYEMRRARQREHEAARKRGLMEMYRDPETNQAGQARP